MTGKKAQIVTKGILDKALVLLVVSGPGLTIETPDLSTD